MARTIRITTERLLRFGSNEDGAILVFFAIMFAVFLGIIAMSFDTGRIASTQSELQSYADSVALAAAGELDGTAGAITRATAAAAELIDDFQTFGAGARDLGPADYRLTFLSELPADDTQPTSAFVTTNSQAAVYVQVDITPRRVPTAIAAAFASLTGQTAMTADVGATAVAGFTAYACDLAVLMFCLPNPGYSANANVGHTIRLRSGGQGAQWGPGDFGFLDPSGIGVDPRGPCAGLSGVNLDTCLIAASGNLLQCFATRGVDIEPGQKVGIENAVFNTRFDIYNKTMNKNRNNSHYAPAPSVITGYSVPTKGNQCIGNNPTAGDTMPFPPDDCFGPPNTCASTAGGYARFGNGGWSAGLARYMDTNYGNANGTLDPGEEVSARFPSAPANPTRYELYKAEINASGPLNDPGQWNSILTGRQETGRPQCSPHRNPNPERRTFVAAGINCDPLNGGTAIAGAARGVKPLEYFRVFLIAPVGNSTVSPPVFDLWVEIVESVGKAGGGEEIEAGIFREVVQLYR